MKERMNVVQLRSSIFLQQNIGYTPENAKQFGELLLPGAKVYGVNPPEALVIGMNPNMPQYGLPWRLFKRNDDGNEYNIVFQPGKIDIVLSNERPYGGDMETNFCNKCIKWFSQILDTQDNIPILRIAYAPLYAIPQNSISSDSSLWNSILKKMVIDGKQCQDINLSFLLKGVEQFGDITFHMNYLCNIFDGQQTKNNGNDISVRNVLLIQLDLNSVPEKVLNLDKNKMEDFYKGILVVKNSLIDNVEF